LEGWSHWTVLVMPVEPAVLYFERPPLQDHDLRRE
jgi:hypothetical protein